MQWLCTCYLFMSVSVATVYPFTGKTAHKSPGPKIWPRLPLVWPTSCFFISSTRYFPRAYNVQRASADRSKSWKRHFVSSWYLNYQKKNTHPSPVETALSGSSCLLNQRPLLLPANRTVLLWRWEALGETPVLQRTCGFTSKERKPVKAEQF
jgi:hypothetical protein